VKHEQYHCLLAQIYSEDRCDAARRRVQENSAHDLQSVGVGVRDPARREFWRYLREAFAAYPDRLDDVILLAALGYHFRKLTEIYCD
jgi:hypothetical protein